MNHMVSKKDELIFEKVKDMYFKIYGSYNEQEVFDAYLIVNDILKKQVIKYMKEQVKDICDEQYSGFRNSIGR